MYTAIYPTPTEPTFLIMEVTQALLNAEGACVGSLGKDLSLVFVNTLLSQIVQGNPLLEAGGRAFVYEQNGLYFIGASHGNIYIQEDCASCAYGWSLTRLRPQESNDSVIAAAGAVLWSGYEQAAPGGSVTGLPNEFSFSVGGEEYLHIDMALADQYGLAWEVSVVLSLTELFKDITTQSMKMLGITAGAIVALSVVASLGITYVVVSPLRQLSEEMESVSSMNLEEVGKSKRSRFYEISVMQVFFLDMVAKLMVCLSCYCPS
jgi:hypothetical protein